MSSPDLKQLHESLAKYAKNQPPKDEYKEGNIDWMLLLGAVGDLLKAGVTADAIVKLLKQNGRLMLKNDKLWPELRSMAVRYPLFVAAGIVNDRIEEIKADLLREELKKVVADLKAKNYPEGLIRTHLNDIINHYHVLIMNEKKELLINEILATESAKN